MYSGAYVPLTVEGNIIVDGVLASCYVNYNHDVAHLVMAPMRWIPHVIDLMFGADNGFSAYVITAENVGIWLLPIKQMW